MWPKDEKEHGGNVKERQDFCGERDEVGRKVRLAESCFPFRVISVGQNSELLSRSLSPRTNCWHEMHDSQIIS